MKRFEENESHKINWHGKIKAIQPRTRVWRYVTDNRTHYHLGYNLLVNGDCDEGKTDFWVAISEKQQQKAGFQIGDNVAGSGWTKKYPKREFADYYRAGALKTLDREKALSQTACPWTGPLPAMQTYEDRGARMLSKSAWQGKCLTCFWAAMANVEIQWDFDRDIKKYRFETYCYGPKSCRNYKMGRARSVPYKDRGSAIDDGYLDELCTEGRGWDE
ncbi:hypothetical protein [Acetobacterium bakii]|uniref:Uncharacterized protein n=1 Tax=Acetobacterium bakii TaxID=52689 RepID=A0A0L6U0H0_9FIRM|nr:hypothetical protein [Acetobacterium bakii]KNZ41315.1 hypothetical protein AKG39_12570 [Acetobacterium bakii]